MSDPFLRDIVLMFATVIIAALILGIIWEPAERLSGAAGVLAIVIYNFLVGAISMPLLLLESWGAYSIVPRDMLGNIAKRAPITFGVLCLAGFLVLCVVVLMTGMFSFRSIKWLVIERPYARTANKPQGPAPINRVNTATNTAKLRQRRQP